MNLLPSFVLIDIIGILNQNLIRKEISIILESSLIDLGVLIKEKLESKGYNFDCEMFTETAFKSLIAL